MKFEKEAQFAVAAALTREARDLVGLYHDTDDVAEALWNHLAIATASLEAVAGKLPGNLTWKVDLPIDETDPEDG